MNYDLNLETAEFLALGLFDFGETLVNARHYCKLYVAERFSRKNAGNSRILIQTPKQAWYYNHVTFTAIAKNFILYCRLINMVSMLYVRLMIEVKVGIPESFKVGW